MNCHGSKFMNQRGGIHGWRIFRMYAAGAQSHGGCSKSVRRPINTCIKGCEKISCRLDGRASHRSEHLRNYRIAPHRSLGTHVDAVGLAMVTSRRASFLYRVTCTETPAGFASNLSSRTTARFI